MWIETQDNRLINLDAVKSIHVENDTVKADGIHIFRGSKSECIKMIKEISRGLASRWIVFESSKYTGKITENFNQ